MSFVIGDLLELSLISSRFRDLNTQTHGLMPKAIVGYIMSHAVHCIGQTETIMALYIIDVCLKGLAF